MNALDSVRGRGVALPIRLFHPTIRGRREVLLIHRGALSLHSSQWDWDDLLTTTTTGGAGGGG